MFSPFPRYLVPLRAKYSRQHHIIKNPQPTFLPEYERPSFTPIQDNRRNFISVYFNLCAFKYQSGKQKILHRMIGSIPWIQTILNFIVNRILIRYDFFLSIRTLPIFRRNYYQSLYCDIVLHSDLEVGPCT